MFSCIRGSRSGQETTHSRSASVLGSPQIDAERLKFENCKKLPKGHLVPYGRFRPWRAPASRVSRIHSDLDLFALLAADSISATSEGSRRQNRRDSLAEPSGSGGRPSLDFLLIIFIVRTQSACIAVEFTLLCAQ